MAATAPVGPQKFMQLSLPGDIHAAIDQEQVEP